MADVLVSNDQDLLPIDADELSRQLGDVFAAEGFEHAQVSVVIVDNATIHQLNVDFLEHDYATDVLSFPLSEPDESPLEGEIVVSAEMAIERAAEFDWTPADELLLYCVHGALHLCGHDDHAEGPRQRMLHRQDELLASFGHPPRRASDHRADD